MNTSLTPHNRHRVRLMRQGKWINGGCYGTAAEAEAALAALKTLHGAAEKTGRRRKHQRGDGEHTRQLSTLPTGVSLTGIHRTVSGYRVQLSRGKGIGMIYGGHTSGPDALKRAVEIRDALLLEYPITY